MRLVKAAKASPPCKILQFKYYVNPSISLQRADFVSFNSFSGTKDSKKDMRMLRMRRCERPSTSRKETNVELEEKMKRGDCQLIVRLISEELRLNRNSIWQIITEDLEICAKIMPRSFHTWDNPQHPHLLL